jgi:hypothetical protein
MRRFVGGIHRPELEREARHSGECYLLDKWTVRVQKPRPCPIDTHRASSTDSNFKACESTDPLMQV